MSQFYGTLPACLGFSRTDTPLLSLNPDGENGWEITIAGCTVDGALTFRGTGRVEVDAGSAILIAPQEAAEGKL